MPSRKPLPPPPSSGPLVLPTDTLATFHTRFWQAQMRSVEEDAERASSSAGPSIAPAAAQEEEEGKKGKGKGKGKRKEAAPVAPASAPGEKFKPGPGQLPLARIKKVMKEDDEIKMISAEAPIIFARACEVFIADLTCRAYLHATAARRRTLLRSDVEGALSKSDLFDFLIDVVAENARASRGKGAADADAEEGEEEAGEVGETADAEEEGVEGREAREEELAKWLRVGVEE
ncbi:histone-fold-containing protein [Tilletiopsis washingtonensis]|uniref:Histone-fold-containing protein n=1 Tax=Tilletiopsis washingtonensis TaxID=58919 RepID=A0A316ZAG8_9BASI|nr:histone-fold-containing protein [Tilletiopsis washingtonensis]PWN98680.1 histone-fold-containing protein [Tilletiopsis washingtonensis]